MARGKHVKGRVRRPEVVEDGDRVTITNGYSAVGTGSDDRGERATGRGSRIADPAPEVLMAAASTNGHDSPDGHAFGGDRAAWRSCDAGDSEPEEGPRTGRGRSRGWLRARGGFLLSGPGRDDH